MKAAVKRVAALTLSIVAFAIPFLGSAVAVTTGHVVAPNGSVVCYQPADIERANNLLSSGQSDVMKEFNCTTVRPGTEGTIVANVGGDMDFMSHYIQILFEYDGGKHLTMWAQGPFWKPAETAASDERPAQNEVSGVSAAPAAGSDDEHFVTTDEWIDPKAPKAWKVALGKCLAVQDVAAAESVADARQSLITLCHEAYEGVVKHAGFKEAESIIAEYVAVPSQSDEGVLKRELATCMLRETAKPYRTTADVFDLISAAKSACKPLADKTRSVLGDGTMDEFELELQTAVCEAHVAVNEVGSPMPKCLP